MINKAFSIIKKEEWHPHFSTISTNSYSRTTDRKWRLNIRHLNQLTTISLWNSLPPSSPCRWARRRADWRLMTIHLRDKCRALILLIIIIIFKITSTATISYSSFTNRNHRRTIIRAFNLIMASSVAVTFLSHFITTRVKNSFNRTIMLSPPHRLECPEHRSALIGSSLTKTVARSNSSTRRTVSLIHRGHRNWCSIIAQGTLIRPLRLRRSCRPSWITTTHLQWITIIFKLLLSPWSVFIQRQVWVGIHRRARNMPSAWSRVPAGMRGLWTPALDGTYRTVRGPGKP